MPFVLWKMAFSLKALTVQYVWSKVINPPNRKTDPGKHGPVSIKPYDREFGANIFFLIC